MGSISATTVWPATTGSPTSASMRLERPAMGAESTKTSRTRVSPSSLTVTTSGPRSARAKSTGTGCGRKA